MSESKIITGITVSGYGGVDKLDLTTRGLTVLFGEPGTGKGDVIRALQTLSAIVVSGTLNQYLLGSTGLDQRFRKDRARAMGLGVSAGIGKGAISYHLSLHISGLETVDIDDEVVKAGLPAKPIMVRHRNRRINFGNHLMLNHEATMTGNDDLLSVIRTIESIRTLNAPRYGTAAQVRRLKSELDEAEWEGFVEDVRLGVGSDVTDVTAVSNTVSLKLREAFEVMPTSASETEYIGLVAMLHDKRERSLVLGRKVGDSMSPGLAARSAQILEEIAETVPVLVTTNSPALLDALSDSDANLIYCYRGGQRKVVYSKIDREKRQGDGVGTLWMQGRVKVILA